MNGAVSASPVDDDFGSEEEEEAKGTPNDTEAGVKILNDKVDGGRVVVVGTLAEVEAEAGAEAEPFFDDVVGGTDEAGV